MEIAFDGEKNGKEKGRTEGKEEQRAKEMREWR